MGHRPLCNWISSLNPGLTGLIMIKTGCCIIMDQLILPALTCSKQRTTSVSREAEAGQICAGAQPGLMSAQVGFYTRGAEIIHVVLRQQRQFRFVSTTWNLFVKHNC